MLEQVNLKKNYSNTKSFSYLDVNKMQLLQWSLTTTEHYSCLCHDLTLPFSTKFL